MIDPNFYEGKIFVVSKLDKFYVDLTPLIDTNMMAQSEFWSEHQILRRSRGRNLWGIRGNLKGFLSPKFSFSHNSEISQWILHYSTPQILWCIQIFYLVILFFGHFSKWSAGVSIYVRATISIRFNAARLMVWPTSAVWHPFLQLAPRCEQTISCYMRAFPLYDSDVTTYVHHHSFQHLMQQPTPSWHRGPET